MSSFGDLSEVVNRLTGGNSGTPEHLWFYHTDRIAGTATAFTAARWNSFWLYDGTPSGASAPGAVAAPDNTTTGGLKQSDPGGGRQKWLLGMEIATQNNYGTVCLYDRLLHISGFDGTVTTAQTVAGALTRYTSGTGNQIWVEIYTTVGVTARTITASYTNQAGTAARTTQSVVFGGTGAREAPIMIQLPLQSGDTGVQAVASVTIGTGSTGTIGNFGVTITHPLLFAQTAVSGGGSIRDALTGLPTLPEIQTDACLALAMIPASAAQTMLYGSVHMVER